MLPQFGVIVRGDMRDAVVTLGTDRLYLTKQRRVTAGFRIVINPHTVLKLEYLHNDEYGGITEFDNDVAHQLTGAGVLMTSLSATKSSEDEHALQESSSLSRRSVPPSLPAK